ncbi:Endoribonuclease ToxN [Methanimicrococcus stummii]|uniref:Endoribonuclease ToxN n=1 Tax=Methanimicrococcus stummii TaxID=3028294 RepID=A0AA96ZX66_9EURY|nr:type III toxin-antitoxin system ToxN/AbiQ family toxin [Methanimicrococcus sp. Es2]WNY28594.1 Endoribonuclease ToxN [Methanimicrococcus sp. Es2]
MQNNGLSFFTVDSDYRNYLSSHDFRVPQKSSRPFTGIVFTVNGYCYYASLASPKPKHVSMNNSVDFIKIDEGNLGVINLNTMIPVPPSLLYDLNPVAMSTSTPEDLQYKNLIQDQLSWINQSHNKSVILKNATRLYYLIIKNKAKPKLKSRCCDFVKLEQKCLDYCGQKKIDFY